MLKGEALGCPPLMLQEGIHVSNLLDRPLPLSLRSRRQFSTVRPKKLMMDLQEINPQFANQ